MSDSSTYKAIDEQAFNDLLKGSSGRPFLVAFTAEWLGEGTIMDAIVEDIANEWHDRMGFYRLDVEQSKGITHQLGIRRLPTIFLFKNGEVFDHIAGMVSGKALRQRIEQMLG